MNFNLLSLQTIIGLTGISILLSAILLRVLLFYKIKKQAAYLISVLLFAMSFISFSGDSISFYFRGLFNDLSITTLILLIYFFTRPEANSSQTRPLFFLVAIAGLFFYPTALGFGPVDPYSWGFINKDHGLLPPLIFIIILAGLMYFAFIKNNSILLLSLVLSTIAFQLGLLESRNIWDYLFDPLIFIYALATTLNYLLFVLILSKKGNKNK